MKARTGCLVKRSSGYSVRIVVDGSVIVRALKTPEGDPCKTAIEARRASAIFTQAFALGSRRDALQAIVKRIADVQTKIDEALSPKVKIADCWERYLASPDKLGSGVHTEKAYRQYTRQFVEWVGGHYPQAVYLQDVTKGIAGEYAQSMKGYNGCTFNKHLIFLRVLFRVLCEDLPNPFGKVKSKPIDSVSHEPLTQEQIQAVLSKTEGELNTLILTGAYTGLRLGDASKLKWSQVDLDKGLITLKPSKTLLRSRKQVCIPIHPELRARLEVQFRKSEYVMPWVAWRYQNDISAMSHKIHNAFTEAGIKTKNAEGRTIYSFHSLRFSLASSLVNASIPIETIQQLLGHSSQTMTRHYSTVNDSTKERAILSLPNIGATA